MLRGPEILEWREVFFRAFFSAESFGDLLLRLDDRIEAYEGALPRRITTAIQTHNSQGTVNELLAAAVLQSPRNKELAGLAARYQAISLPSVSSLEGIVHETNSQLDFGVWLERAVAVQNAVCRIEVPLSNGKVGFGTGFLIGEDRVMTNWHVLEPLDPPGGAVMAHAEDVRCRFDYRSFADGTQSRGAVFSLAADWCVLWSPNNSDGTEPTDLELDCSVVRLARCAGSLAAGPRPDAQVAPRGWINLPSTAPLPFARDTPLFIVQHPQARPIKLTLDTSAISGMNPARNRVRYTTNTEAGSSGSPCFDQNWNLVALHHSGEPNYQPTWNEGVPMNKIVSLLEAKYAASAG